MELPEKIKSLVSEHIKNYGLPTVIEKPIEKGDIRMVRSETSRHHVVIHKVFESPHGTFMTGMLCHPFLEMADASDAIFLAGELTAYPLVVQACMYVTIWESQIEECVAILESPEIANKIAGLIWGEEDYGLLTGTSIVNQSDSRWVFKESQAVDAQTLSSNCLSTILAPA